MSQNYRIPNPNMVEWHLHNLIVVVIIIRTKYIEYIFLEYDFKYEGFTRGTVVGK